MQLFTITISSIKKLNKCILAFAIFFLSASVSNAQIRKYGLVYSDNIKGGSTIFGNTLMNIITGGKIDTVKMNDNRIDGNSIYGNDNSDMEFVDIDGNTGYGSVTRNSSTADLILPAGTNTIKLARLYWGGRISDADYDLTKTANRTIKIRKGTANAYSDVTALGMDTTIITTGYTEYQAYADITSFVKNNGTGTYEVGNVPLSTGAVSNGGNHGGWSIVVVYENSSLPYNSVRLYDGFEVVYNGGNDTTSTVTLTGLNVPSGTLADDDAKMGVVAWEGDANLAGDFLKINGNTFSNATNPADNPWNGTITDIGVHVTTKNPNYTNQMGIDIDRFNVGTGYGINPNAQNVTLEFGTEADKYFPGVFTFTIRMKDPTITLEKTVADANNNHLAESGEILTYTLQGGNNGPGNANNIVISDTLPSYVTYKPGSLKVMSSPGIAAGTKTDQPGDDVAEYISNGAVKSVFFRIGTGATATHGGTLAAGQTYQVQFQVTVNDPGYGNPVPSIMNIARITSTSDAGVNFVDDGTAIINPEAGPMPVTLTRFTATLMQNNQVQVGWATSMEINCKQFVVQRSYDGKVFTDQETVAGSGTTNLAHSYSVNDNVSSFTGNTIYYRLKQIDIDGKENLSKIIPVKLQTNSTSAIVSPNPFRDFININLQWDGTEMVSAKIYSIQGRQLLSKQILVNKGNNNIKISDLSNLPSGNYILEISSSSQKIIQKIIK
ncbi:MAG: T9SS type A sorting domain-containing protein [Bacteroidota bacterium]|nr:T9SS type A sorting domain-containing protein [Bacteroidota bacterium]